jgi:hypothetical protein
VAVRSLYWLTRTFGFPEHYRYGEPLSGEEICLGKAYIMLATAKTGNASAAQVGNEANR